MSRARGVLGGMATAYDAIDSPTSARSVTSASFVSKPETAGADAVMKPT